MSGMHYVAGALIAGALHCLPAVADALREVQGRWMRQERTAAGQLVNIVKEHRGASTVLTAYDEQGTLLYAHESQFKLQAEGRLRVLMFYNRRITAGPNTGSFIKEPGSYIYRIDGGRFIEVQGMLEGDTSPPRIIVWERLEDDAGTEQSE